MAFTVVHPNNSQPLWAPIKPSATVYNGSIIGQDVGSLAVGVSALPAAAGAANVTNLDAPWGVVIGFNQVSGNQTWSSTYNAEYVTAGAESASYTSTTQYQGVEGPWPKGDPWPYAQYIPITAETVLKGPIWGSAYGTALTVGTVSTASGGDGLDFTSSSFQCTTVADLATVYFRTGACRGVYRQVVNASATAIQYSPACIADVAVGDTAVVANVPPFGTGRMYIDSTGSYIDGTAALTSNYLLVDIIRVDLSEPGGEYVEFRFNPINFNTVDRLTT